MNIREVAGERLLTSESVTAGHPDKVADRISDAILDACLLQDPLSRVAVETLVSRDLVVLAGEITTSAQVDLEQVARRVIAEIGYERPDLGFSAGSCRVIQQIQKQSAQIAMGVDKAQDTDGQDAFTNLGAGDQGIMFGYATDETPELMPLPIWLSHRLAQRLTQARTSGEVPWLRPDGKTQVTVAYRNGIPNRIDTVILSCQHEPTVSSKEITQTVCAKVLAPVLPAELFSSSTRVLVNPTGLFTDGGPAADTGLTGRKIIVDTYGGLAHHGGGCFSGKDATKVDRTGAYACRWLAKHVVKAGLARRCEIQVAYSIGVAQPVAIHLETFGTSVVPEGQISTALSQIFDLRPGVLIRDLQLRNPIFQNVSAFGHFGRADLDLPWERTERVAKLLSASL